MSGPSTSVPTQRPAAHGGRTLPALVLAVVAPAVLAGLVAAAVGDRALADAAWLLGCSVGLVAGLWWLAVGLRRAGSGVDVLGVLALVAAMATGELLAGAVVAVMLATGRVLEAWAEGRAQQTLTGLLERAPSVARREEDGRVQEVPVAEVAVGDVLVVAAGDLIPVDGIVLSGASAIDASTLTGEPEPVACGPGDAVRSGTSNLGGPFRLRATAGAAHSPAARRGSDRSAGWRRSIRSRRCSSPWTESRLGRSCSRIPSAWMRRRRCGC